MAVQAALPPGVLSLHVLPAEHHDKDWDAIIVPAGVKERLLAQALLALQHGRRLSTLAGLPHGLIVLAGPPACVAFCELKRPSGKLEKLQEHRRAELVAMGFQVAVCWTREQSEAFLQLVARRRSEA